MYKNRLCWTVYVVLHKKQALNLAAICIQLKLLSFTLQGKLGTQLKILLSPGNVNAERMKRRPQGLLVDLYYEAKCVISGLNNDFYIECLINCP